MLLLILFPFIKLYNFKEEYVNEAYNILDPTKSPAKLTFIKGLSLTMVEWPETILNISIPEENVDSIIITKETGLSVFTFRNNATVELTFNKSTSYFVSGCPQRHSQEGAIQYITNDRNNLFTAKKLYQDVYFSSFGPYLISGTVENEWYWTKKNKLVYKTDENTTKETESLKNMNINAVYTSYLFRPAKDYYLTFNDLAISSSDSFESTILTRFDVNFDVVTQDENNYATNQAYGGIKGTDSYKTFEINLINYSAIIDVNATLGEVFSTEFSNGTIYSINDTISIHKKEPFTLKLLINYKGCDNHEIQTILISNLETINIFLTDNDIPPECIISESSPISISPSLYPISPSPIPSPISVSISPSPTPTPISPSTSPTSPLPISLSISPSPSPTPISPSTSPTSPLPISVTISPSPSATSVSPPPISASPTHTPVPREYVACADISLPSGFEAGYSAGGGPVTPATRGVNVVRGAHPFSLSVFLTASPRCSGAVLIATVQASTQPACARVGADSVPSRCRARCRRWVAAVASLCALLLAAALGGVAAFVVVRRRRAQNKNSEVLGKLLSEEEAKREYVF